MHIMKYYSAIKMNEGASLISKESTCQCRRHGFDPWVKKIPRRRAWQATLVLPGKSQGQRSLVGYSPTGPRRVGHNLASKRQQQITLGSNLCCMFCRFWQMHYVLCPPFQGHTEVSPPENPYRQPIHPSPNQSLATTLTVAIILPFPDFTFKE